MTTDRSPAHPDAPRLSVVVPVFNNESTLVELHRRIDEATRHHGPFELVLVDDGSADRSASVLEGLGEADPRVLIVRHAQNRGQGHAVVSGLREARGDRIVVLDADLQDPPEAIPSLLEPLDGGAWHAVFAGRHARYSSPVRTLTGRVFKHLAARLTLAPRDAGGFVAMDRTMLHAVLDLDPRRPYLLGMIGATGLAQTSVPITRDHRPSGTSGYRSRDRLRLALPALFDMAWTWRRASRRAGVARQQDTQLSYYAGPAISSKRRMHPADTIYVRRHVERVVDFANITPSDRVIDVACGLGKYTLALAARGLDVSGLDLSPSLLEGLDDANGGRWDIPTWCADLLAPPEELLGRFDVVTCFMGLHHLPDLQGAFESMRRLTVPGGRVALLEPNAYCPSYYAQITLTPSMSWRGDRGVMKMRATSLRRAATGAGLVDVEIRRVGCLPPALMNRPWGRRVEDLIDTLPGEPLRAFQLMRARVPLGAEARTMYDHEGVG